MGGIHDPERNTVTEIILASSYSGHPCDDGGGVTPGIVISGKDARNLVSA
jgi:hypothetical protein